MRALRKLDELRRAQKVAVGLAKGGGGKHGRKRVIEKPTLASQGIDKNLAHKGRVLGAMSEEAFEGAVAKARTAVTLPKSSKPKACVTAASAPKKHEPFSRIADVSTLHSCWNAASRDLRRAFVNEVGLVNLYAEASAAEKKKLADMIQGMERKAKSNGATVVESWGATASNQTNEVLMNS